MEGRIDMTIQDQKIQRQINPGVLNPTWESYKKLPRMPKSDVNVTPNLAKSMA